MAPLTVAAPLRVPAPAERYGPADTLAAEAERDRITRRALLAALPDGAAVLAFDPRWWDGAAWAACLTARVGGNRWRVVPVGATALVLPGRQGAARRALRQWRAASWQGVRVARRRLLARAPVARPAPLGHQPPDHRTCGCRALVRIAAGGAQPPCPRCGAAS